MPSPLTPSVRTQAVFAKVVELLELKPNEVRCHVSSFENDYFYFLHLAEPTGHAGRNHWFLSAQLTRAGEISYDRVINSVNVPTEDLTGAAILDAHSLEDLGKAGAYLLDAFIFLTSLDALVWNNGDEDDGRDENDELA